MIIACLTLPGFLVQVHVRRTPSLAGRAFAVVQERGGEARAALPREGRSPLTGAPRVIAMSRAARDAGVQVDMTVTQACAACGGLVLVDDEPTLARETLEALGEALLALSVTVDLDTPGAVFLHVPPSAKGAEGLRAFGARAIALATRQGLASRVGIADDRFTALVAARAGVTQRGEITIVPAGGAAKFLAPLPLSHLPVDPDVRRTLGLLGVRSLGDFAALPTPSVGRRWAAHGADLQTLARGEDRAPLRGWMPVERVAEIVELDDEVTTLEPVQFVLRPLLERAVLRLAGRGKAVGKMVLTLEGRKDSTEVTLAPARPADSVALLFDLARAALAERRITHAITRVGVCVPAEGEAEPQGRVLELFGGSPAAIADGVDRAVARLTAAFGPGSAQGVALADAHRPEATFQLVPFAPPLTRSAGPSRPAPSRSAPTRRKRAGRAQAAPAATVPLWAARPQTALRLLEQPLPLVGLLVPGGQLVGATLTIDVAAVSGPTRMDGEWWAATAFDRSYFEVRTVDGARYWLYQAADQVFLHGVFD